MHVVQYIESFSPLQKSVLTQKESLLGVPSDATTLPSEYLPPVLATLERIKSMGERMIKEALDLSEPKDQQWGSLVGQYFKDATEAFLTTWANPVDPKIEKYSTKALGDLFSTLEKELGKVVKQLMVHTYQNLSRQIRPEVIKEGPEKLWSELHLLSKNTPTIEGLMAARLKKSHMQSAEAALQIPPLTPEIREVLGMYKLMRENFTELQESIAQATEESWVKPLVRQMTFEQFTDFCFESGLTFDSQQASILTRPLSPLEAQQSYFSPLTENELQLMQQIFLTEMITYFQSNAGSLNAALKMKASCLTFISITDKTHPDFQKYVFMFPRGKAATALSIHFTQIVKTIESQTGVKIEYLESGSVESATLFQSLLAALVWNPQNIVLRELKDKVCAETVLMNLRAKLSASGEAEFRNLVFRGQNIKLKPGMLNPKSVEWDSTHTKIVKVEDRDVIPAEEMIIGVGSSQYLIKKYPPCEVCCHRTGGMQLATVFHDSGLVGSPAAASAAGPASAASSASASAPKTPVSPIRLNGEEVPAFSLFP